MNKHMVFSHSDLDGVGCVILAMLAFGKENVDYEICNYDNVNSKIREFYLNDRDKSYDAVYITDISVDDEVAAEIDSLVDNDGNWYLLDHHATALRLNRYIWADVRVEMEDGVKTSGTELFYEHLFENGYFEKYSVSVLQNIHRFVEIVRDYDTWRWKTELGDEGIVCKQVNDLFHIYGREKFIEWVINTCVIYIPNHNRYIDNLNSSLGCDSGEKYITFPWLSEFELTLLEQKQKEIDIYVAQKNKQINTFIDKSGHPYGVVFIERFASEVGNRLNEINEDLHYIAMINLSNGTVNYRTTRDGIDLGLEVAAKYGGGGHKKAAGSQFDIDAVQMLILNEIFKEV